MSSLLSAIDEYRNQDLSNVGLRSVCDDVATLSRAMNAAESEVLRRVAYLAVVAPFHPDGLPWPAWLATTAGMSYQPAKERVEAAAALREMPETSRAFADGEVSYQKVRELTAAHKVKPDLFPQSEASLVDAARNLDPGALRRTVTYWAQNDDLSADEDARRYRARRLDLSTARDGMVVLNGCLDPVGGEYVISAIRSVTDTRFDGPDDDRTPTQRRADALVEICRAHLGSSDRAQVGGERPHLTVTVDLATLERRAGEGAGRRCELSNGGVISAEAARRVACDGAVSRIITDGASQPLDVGRLTRVISSAQRRAVIHRDRTCRWKGCGKPARYCDVHHIIHWADGGRTDLDNLILLCHHHHTLTHEGGYQITGTATDLTITRPDGTTIDDP